MKKKLFVLVAVCLVAFGALTGCTGTGTGSGVDNVNPTTSVNPTTAPSNPSKVPTTP